MYIRLFIPSKYLYTRYHLLTTLDRLVPPIYVNPNKYSPAMTSNNDTEHTGNKIMTTDIAIAANVLPAIADENTLMPPNTMQYTIEIAAHLSISDEGTTLTESMISAFIIIGTTIRTALDTMCEKNIHSRLSGSECVAHTADFL